MGDFGGGDGDGGEWVGVGEVKRHCDFFGCEKIANRPTMSFFSRCARLHIHTRIVKGQNNKSVIKCGTDLIYSKVAFLP